jgi:hypothetical protein
MIMPKLNFYTPTLLSEVSMKADPIADQAFEALLFSGGKSRLKRLFNEVHVNGDVIPPDLPAEVKTFFAETKALPAWADYNLMQQGAAFFAKYSPDILNLMGFLSLPYSYANKELAKTLTLAEGIIGNINLRLKNLMEFVVEVTNKHAFEKRGKGIVLAQKQRLTHAAIRYQLIDSGRWADRESIPLSQESLAIQNLTYSLIVIRGLRKIGIEVSYEDAVAYMHLWNVLGYIMGIDERLLPDTGKDALQLDQLICRKQFESTQMGKDLTFELLNHLKESEIPKELSHTAPTYMRFLLGDRIADLLDIPGLDQLVEKPQIWASSTCFKSRNDIYKYRVNDSLHTLATQIKQYFDTDKMIAKQDLLSKIN